MSVAPHLELPLAIRLKKAVDHITGRGAVMQGTGALPSSVGIILGSGLGSFAEKVQAAHVVPYAEIPEFPVSGVTGHAGNLVIGHFGEKTVIVMQGRSHYYEGHSLDAVTFPVRVMKALGADTLILTNAAGGINERYSPGDLVLLADHISLLPEHPLRGPNDDTLGPRFVDMTHTYDRELRTLAEGVADKLGFALHSGVYAALPGPSYETPAEVRMLRTLGADLCGMSTVPEVIVARHQGMRCLGISCVTNLAAGITDEPLSHQEVTETAARVRDRFVKLVGGIVQGLT